MLNKAFSLLKVSRLSIPTYKILPKTEAEGSYQGGLKPFSSAQLRS
ncbi:hypothetical protein NIES4074_61610 (plasmid) [Cylindrospermum sp. NIES-4074]|nr:hypothetical protein NIES4074_61610 [Cylindrospermum sp. NIES-4074]